jgi:GAF domain-containing protein
MILSSNNWLQEISAYCEPENLIGSLANVSALIKDHYPDINWIGFYLFDGQKLVLGPFQGKPACTRIDLGRGVCGKAALDRKTLLIKDVSQFSDHIVCDSASQSEIVVPILQNSQLMGVLDVDSPLLGRFKEEDQTLFEAIVDILVQHLKFKDGL